MVRVRRDGSPHLMHSVMWQSAHLPRADATVSLYVRNVSVQAVQAFIRFASNNTAPCHWQLGLFCSPTIQPITLQACLCLRNFVALGYHTHPEACTPAVIGVVEQSTLQQV